MTDPRGGLLAKAAAAGRMGDILKALFNGTACGGCSEVVKEVNAASTGNYYEYVTQQKLKSTAPAPLLPSDSRWVGSPSADAPKKMFAPSPFAAPPPPSTLRGTSFHAPPPTTSGLVPPTKRAPSAIRESAERTASDMYMGPESSARTVRFGDQDPWNTPTAHAPGTAGGHHAQHDGGGVEARVLEDLVSASPVGASPAQIKLPSRLVSAASQGEAWRDERDTPPPKMPVLVSGPVLLGTNGRISPVRPSSAEPEILPASSAPTPAKQAPGGFAISEHPPSVVLPESPASTLKRRSLFQRLIHFGAKE